MTSTPPADRLVPLRGTFNLRDIGGYSARTGKTRWGKLYRSDALHHLEQTDRDELRRRNIGIILDLRGDEERVLSPSRLDDVELDVILSPVSPAPIATFLAADSSLDELYDYLIDHCGAGLVAAIRIIARSGPTPVLVHCTAGKDRTGLVVALALTVAGVNREDVLADYAATESHLPVELLDEIVRRLRAEHATGGVHLDELVRLSPSAVLERTLDRIEQRHGSIDRYLIANGLDDEDLGALRTVLIEEPRD